MDLVRDGLERVASDLVHGARSVLDDDDLLVPLGEAGQSRREREALGKGVVHRLEHVVRDARPDHREQDRRSHGHPEPEDRLVGLLDGVAVLERVHEGAGQPRQDAVDDEAGLVADDHHALPEACPDLVCGGKRRVVRLGGADELEERHQRDGVEEVHSDDALGAPEVGGHVGNGQRGRVRGDHALGGDELLDLREHPLLHVELLEDRLEHEVAVRESVVLGRAGDDRPEKRSLSRVVAPFRRELVDLAADLGERLLHLLVAHIAKYDRYLQPAQEEGRDLPRHESRTDDADLLDLVR